MPTPPPTLAWRAFHLPRRGHAPAEYEDAFAADPCSGRFAVADGASESSFAGRWARLLVEGFVGGAQDPWGADWLVPLRRRWVEEVAPLPLPWYAEAKREQGAFATLLGVALGDAAFAAWVEERRDGDGLRNDDTTLILIDV